MLRRIALTVVLVLSPGALAFAGIIGVGGSNSLGTSEAFLQKLDSAEDVYVKSEDYRRLSIRLSTHEQVKAEIKNKNNEKEQAEFIKVYLNSEPSIVDTNFRMKLRTIAP